MWRLKEALGKRPVRTAALALLALTFFVGAYNAFKPLPAGLSVMGPLRPATGVAFFRDVTYLDPSGKRTSEQEIFDEVFRLIRGADRLVLLDMFLYNPFQGKSPERTRALSGELTETLISKKLKDPGIRIIVITDPINTVYGGATSEQFNRLREAGVEVVISRLESLRDSNPLYSALWRTFFGHFSNGEGDLMPNPFGTGRVSLRSYLRLLNFKANHRKVLVVDSADGLVGLVTSANAHDGSSAHSNVALRFSGPAVTDLLRTERAVLEFSGGPALDIAPAPAAEPTALRAAVLTERGIKRAVLKGIEAAGQGDRIDLAMFYLSDRDVVGALKGASHRGVSVRVVLDPNKDAFGHKRNGVPNRQVARELKQAGAALRWCDTHGEQCHSKMMLIGRHSGPSTLVVGSANFTRRNLMDLNLETDVMIEGPPDAAAIGRAGEYFNTIWSNRAGRRYTVRYEAYADDSALRVLLYRVMESTGLSTF